MPDPPVPPASAVADLVPPDVRAALPSVRHPEGVDVWHGIVWSRLGRNDHAWAWWDRVGAPDLGPWVAAERARALRELGAHEAAERFDEAGLAEAVDVVDVVMLRLGLVADAIGRGDAATAQLRWDAVTPLLDRLPSSPRVARQRLRRSWIAVELGFLTGGSPPVDDLPAWRDGAPRFPPDYGHGSAFHRAKGLLFGGVARSDGRLLDAACDLAPPVLAWALELARDDRGRDGALERAREAWARIVPPPGFAAAVTATPHARRLAPTTPAAPEPP